MDGMYHVAFIHQIDKPEYLDMIAHDHGPIWTAATEAALTVPVAVPASVTPPPVTQPVAVPTSTMTENSYFPTLNVPLWQIKTPTPPMKMLNQLRNKRHKHLSDDELGEIAAARLSKNTDGQTTWRVRILKGKQFILKNCTHKS